MNLERLSSELKSISLTLEKIDKEMPDMTAMDFAYERSFITTEEWESADKMAKENVILQEAELEKINALREEYPLIMKEFVDQKLHVLTDLLLQLKSIQEPRNDSNIPFKISIVESLIDTLTAWSMKKKHSTWYTWTWRLLFKYEEECIVVLSSYIKSNTIPTKPNNT